jgi:hypothetical protein
VGKAAEGGVPTRDIDGARHEKMSDLPPKARQKVGSKNTDSRAVLDAREIFPATKPDEVFASLRYDGAPKSVEDMDAAIAAEAKRRHARD